MSFAIAAVDELPLYYERWGTRGAPLVLLDGIGCDGYVWRYLRRDLAERTTVHLHYRGHGRTPVPDDLTHLTLATLADDVVSVMDDAELPQGVLVGHSMGVQVALETYRRHASRVRGLVLLCGASSQPLRTFKGSAVLEGVLPTAQQVVGRFPAIINRVSKALLPTRLAYEIAVRTEVRRDAVDMAAFMPYLEGMAHIDSRLFVSVLAAAASHSADDLLASVRVPTLVIGGGRDTFTPPERSRFIAAHIPCAEYLEVAEGSHTAPIEEPALINSAIASFLSTKIDVGDECHLNTAQMAHSVTTTTE